MKIIWRLFFIISVLFPFSSSYSQSTFYSGEGYDVFNATLGDIYLYREPSPKADAMGRSGVAAVSNDFGSYYNPALTSLGKGITVNTSFSSHLYLAEETSYNYFGVGYSDKKLGSFSISRYHWNLGEMILTDETGRETGRQDGLGNSLYTLNYSREVINDFFAGVNIGYIYSFFGKFTDYDATGKCYTLDFGLLKRINIPAVPNSNLIHSVQLGASMYNVTGTKISYSDPNQKNPLPQILRLGASYNMKIKGGKLIPNSNLIETLTQFEYQKVTNSNYFSAFKLGQELTISEIFSIRAGYFTQSINNFNNPDYNASSQSSFTYGAGVKIPVNLIFDFKTPASLDIDYVNMKPASFTVVNDWKNFIQSA